jgi:hypothetical protein
VEEERFEKQLNSPIQQAMCNSKPNQIIQQKPKAKVIGNLYFRSVQTFTECKGVITNLQTS